MKNVKGIGITAKLLLFLLIGVLSVGITGWFAYRDAKHSLKESCFNQLTAIRETKKRQIESYFGQIRNQITTLSESQMTVDAMDQYRNAFFALETDDSNIARIEKYKSSLEEYYQEEFLPKLGANTGSKGTIEQYWPEDEEESYHHAVLLQYNYIVSNPNPIGSKDELEKANDGSEYSLVHSKYHSLFRRYAERFGYYDIFLIDAETGNIVYSVSKEVDFATNLFSGPYKDTNFARVVKETIKSDEKNYVKLIDFELYNPSYAAPASFIASPIFDGDRKSGVLVFQLPINEINRVMTGDFNWKYEGLGESGETYIVGSDYKMRNDSRFIIEEPNEYLDLLSKLGVNTEVVKSIKTHSTSILFQDVRTESVQDAIKGNKDTDIIKDYRGIEVLSSYSPLDIKDVKWVILSEIDKDEVFSVVNKLRDKILVIIAIVSCLIICAGLIFTIRLSEAEKEINSQARFPIENPNPVLRVAENGTVLFANSAGLILVGSWGIQIGQSVPGDWHKYVLDALRTGTSSDYELECNDYLFSITLAPVTSEGYVNFYGLNITERKKMEKTVLQLEKLKSLGTITAGVAHEFNNILAIISGKTQLIALDYKEDKELTDGLGLIQGAVKDGAKISDRMLTFTKTEKYDIDFTSNDIRSLTKQSITFTMPRWKNEAQAGGIDYKMNIDGMKKVPSILCNPTEIREIFINIINNALDAMPEGGSLLFCTWSTDKTVFASVSDTGEGMPEGVKKRIFDPFFTTKLPVGTGLGMSTVYGIVTRHNGKIEVESELGKGSTFTLQFPTTIKTVNPIAAPDQEQEIKGNSLRILVVDDEEVICNILDESLSSNGHNVKTVDNGEEALGLIKSERYDLVLTDMAMPDVSGHEIIKSLNETEKRPKIGLITGWGKNLECLDEEGMKVDFIIKKPFQIPVLIKQIQSLFSENSR